MPTPPSWTPGPGFFRGIFTDRVGDDIATGTYALLVHKDTGDVGRVALKAGGELIINPGNYGHFSAFDKFWFQIFDNRGNGLIKTVTMGAGANTDITETVSPISARCGRGIFKTIMVRSGVVV
jgi:hypothetical protein